MESAQSTQEQDPPSQFPPSTQIYQRQQQQQQQHQHQNRNQNHQEIDQNHLPSPSPPPPPSSSLPPPVDHTQNHSSSSKSHTSSSYDPSQFPSKSAPTATAAIPSSALASSHQPPNHHHHQETISTQSQPADQLQPSSSQSPQPSHVHSQPGSVASNHPTDKITVPPADKDITAITNQSQPENHQQQQQQQEEEKVEEEEEEQGEKGEDKYQSTKELAVKPQQHEQQQDSTSPSKKKRSLLRIASRHSSNSHHGANSIRASSSSDTSKQTTKSRFSRRRPSTAAAPEIPGADAPAMSTKSGGSSSAASSIKRRFSSAGSKRGSRSRKPSDATTGKETERDSGYTKNNSSNGNSSEKQHSQGADQQEAKEGHGHGQLGQNATTAAPPPTTATTTATTANAGGNDTTATTIVTSTSKKKHAANNFKNKYNTKPSATHSEKPTKAPSRFFAFFACCTSSHNVTEEDLSTPAARPAKAGSRQGTSAGNATAGNGGGRLPLPSKTPTFLDGEKTQDGFNLKKDSGEAREENADAAATGALNEKQQQLQEADSSAAGKNDRIEKSVQQTVAAAFGGEQSSVDQEGSAAQLRTRNGQVGTAVAGNLDLEEEQRQQQQDRPPTTPPKGTEPSSQEAAHAVHAAASASAAAVEQLTSMMPEPEDQTARENPDEVDDETSMALDEAVTSPTPVIPQTADGPDLEAQEQRLQPNDPSLRGVADDGEESEPGDTSAVATTTQTQQQPPLPPPTTTMPTDVDQEGQPWLLPPMEPHLKSRKCLVLDLDETLVHSSFKVLDKADFTIPVEIEGQYHNIYVIKRPGVDQFMKRVGELYEVVVFTASVSKYGDPLLDQLDIHKVVHHRLFRDSCHNHFGNYVKDLARVGRDLREVIIIDNSPTSYIFHPEHAIPISSWFSDVHDNELLDLIPVLEDLADSKVTDVRLVLNVAL